MLLLPQAMPLCSKTLHVLYYVLLPSETLPRLVPAA